MLDELFTNKNIILLSYLILCFMVYFIYPKNSFFDYISIFIFLLFVLFFIILIYVFYIQKNTKTNLVKILNNHFLFLMFILFILVFIYIISLTVMSLSFKYIFIFYILSFSFIHSYFNIENFDFVKSYLQIFIYMLFYLPCLFKDLIQLLVNDAKNTTKTTYIILILLIVFILYLNFSYFIYSLFSSNTNSVVLVNKKRKLNTKILSIRQDVLLEKIKNKEKVYNKESFQTLSNYEFKNAKDTINQLKENIENLKKYFSFNDTIQIIIDKYKDNPELMKKKINEELNNNIILKVKYTLLKYKNKYFLTDEISRNENDIIIGLLEKDVNRYHYGISFWIYLNSDILMDETKNKDIIVSFNSKPSLYYDYNEKSLVIEFIETKEDNSKIKRLYKSDKLLFQKWNHVVMNYVNGQYDLFINNELVSTHSNIVPYIHSNETLTIGNEYNKDLGAISKVMYFDQPLGQSKINSIYNSNDY